MSGFLLKDKYLAGTFRAFTLRNIKSLVFPYISFWVISYLYWLPTQSMRSKMLQYAESSPFDPFIGLLYGVGESLYVNSVLWFFTCLFCTTILFYWVSKLKDRRVILFVLILLGLLGPLIHHHMNVRLPWNLELSFVAIVFYGLGYVVSKSEASRLASFSKLRYLGIVVLCGILLLTVKFNGRVNMNKMQLGNLALFYSGAFSGIGVSILLSSIVPRNIFFEWLSRNTIVIFPLHMLIFSAFTGIGVTVFRIDYSFNENLMFSVLYTIGAFAVCYPTSYILSNHFPWIVGQRTTLPMRALQNEQNE